MRHALFVIIAAAVYTGLSFLADTAGPLSLAARGNPLAFLWIASLSLAAGSFIMSFATREYSWVDRIWSVAPAVYAWFLAVRGWPDMRLTVAAVLIALWGARLTFNFARKGGYTGTEDYRWAEVRKKFPNEALWQLFNLLFISLYQNILIMMITLPLYAAFRTRGTAGSPWNALDTVAAALFLGMLVLESVADQEQWNFHQAKKKTTRKKNGTRRGGFLQEGLFRYSRHPNYFAEICMWWCVYLFAVSATGRALSWQIMGPVLLTLLFQGSTALTESLSRRKYPDYARYCRRTSRILPWIPRKAP